MLVNVTLMVLDNLLKSIQIKNKALTSTLTIAITFNKTIT
jgi:hypothetical protein